MVSGEAIIVAMVVAGLWFAGAETVKGVKWVGKKVVRIVHPKQKPARSKVVSEPAPK